MCEEALKFELLVFLAAPTAVLRLSFPFLLLERKRNRLQQVQPPTDPQNRVDSLTQPHTSVKKVLKLDSQTCISSFPSLCLFHHPEGQPTRAFLRFPAPRKLRAAGTESTLTLTTRGHHSTEKGVPVPSPGFWCDLLPSVWQHVQPPCH